MGWFQSVFAHYDRWRIILVSSVYVIVIALFPLVIPPANVQADGITTISTTSALGTGTTIVVNKPASVANDDILIAHVATTGGSLNITAPAGWTTITTSNTANSSSRTFWKRINGSEGASFTFDTNQITGRRLAAGIVNYRGVSTDSNPIDIIGTSNSGTNNTSVTATGITPTESNTKLLSVFNAYRADNTVVTFTPPSNTTERIDVRSNTAATTNIATSVIDEHSGSTAASGNRIATASNSASEWSAHMFGLEPDGVQHMMLFWDGTDYLGNSISLPAGWSFVDDFDGRFVRGEAPANFGVIGGNAQHAHTVTTTTVGAGNGGEYDSGGNTPAVATTAHTHTFGTIAEGSSYGNGDNNPAHRTVRLIRYDTGIPNIIPVGAIVLFDGSPGIPGIDFNVVPEIDQDWFRLTDFDNRFVKADGGASANAGIDTHTHSINWSSLNASTGSVNYAGLLANSTTSSNGHTHAAPAGTTTSTNGTSAADCDAAPVANQCLPPHVQIKLAKAKENTPTLSVGITAMFDGSPGGGWVVRSGVGGVYYQRFLRGNAAYVENLGATTHDHIDQTQTSAASVGTGNQTRNLVGNQIEGPHSHLLTSNPAPADHTPPYFNVVIAEKVNFILERYRWFDSTGVLNLNNTTDAWGPYDVALNTAIPTLPAGFRPPDYTQELRLRMSISVNNNPLAAGEVKFKLQYKEGTDMNCTTDEDAWFDVDAPGGPGVWRYSSSTAIPDNSVLTNSVFAAPVSPAVTVFGRYLRSQTTATNPNSAAVGDFLEYDFHIEHNDSSTGAKKYSFRPVEDAPGSPILLSQYGSNLNDLCPTLTTRPQSNNQLRHGNFFEVTGGVERGFYWSD